MSKIFLQITKLYLSEFQNCICPNHRKIVCSLDPALRPCLQVASQNIFVKCQKYLFKLQNCICLNFKIVFVQINVRSFAVWTQRYDLAFKQRHKIYLLKFQTYLFKLHNCICPNCKIAFVQNIC